MNSPNSLSELLQSWQAQAPEACDFNRSVWASIEVAENHRGSCISSFFALFARPRIAVTAAVLALFGGIFLGNLHARSSEAEDYLQSLNPYSTFISHDHMR